MCLPAELCKMQRKKRETDGFSKSTFMTPPGSHPPKTKNPNPSLSRKGLDLPCLVRVVIQKKSSSVKITLLLKVDLEGFEPLTSRMRTERSPNSLAFVHTLCTVRKEKSTYIRPYKTTCHPNGLSWSQVWFPIC